MIKKILPVSIFVLLVVLIILLGIQNLMNKAKSQGNTSITPTLFQGKNTGGYTPQTSRTSNTSSQSPTGTSAEVVAKDLQSKLPIYTPDFTLKYSPRMQKYVTTLTSEEGELSYSNWLDQNLLYRSELEDAIITKQSLEELDAALDYAKERELSPEQKAKEDVTIFTNTLNTLINLPFLFMQSTGTTDETTATTNEEVAPTPVEQTMNLSPTSPTISSNLPNLSNSSNLPNRLSYYSQCDGPYDEKPLPGGCTVCKAGCGPVSVSMILSSYVDKTLNPLKTIALMDKAGVRMGCYGSYISEIYAYLKSRNDLKVSDFIIPSDKELTAKEIAKDFEGYTKSGWTIFVLANFKKGAGGHYFWVTDVKSNGDILAYDPYYGKGQSPPISENKYTPAPYYRYAFAIKKSG